MRTLCFRLFLSLPTCALTNVLLEQVLENPIFNLAGRIGATGPTMTVRTDTGPDRDSVKKMNRMLLPNYQRSSGPVPGKLFYFLVEQPTRSLPEVLALN